MVRKDSLPDVVGAVAGVAFAIALFLSIASIDPLRAATDQELQEWWNDGGLRRDSIISMYLMLAAAPCFLVFVSVLRSRLRTNDAESPWPDLVHGSGVVFAALLCISAVARGLIAQAVRFGDEPLPGPDTLRYATELQYVVYGLAAIPFAAIVIVVTSILVLRHRILASWVGWLGLGVAVVSLGLFVAMVGPFATPFILVWVVGTSIHLLLTRGSQVAGREAVGGAALAEAQGVTSHP
jgi:hypothetical protein